MSQNQTANSNDFLLPDLGEGLEEAELIEWCVEVGQRVDEFENLARMETAKAIVDVPSPRAGTVAVLHAKPGQFVKVGMPLVTFAAEQDSPDAIHAADEERHEDAGTVVGELVETPGLAAEPGKVLAAPAVRRLAREVGIDIETVKGTGIGGRVTARDVQTAAGVAPLKSPVPANEPEQPPPYMPVSKRPSDGNGAMSVRIPFRGVRRTIAEHLRYSVSHAVHFCVMDEADVSALEELRRNLVAASGEKVSLLPFVASAVCRVLSVPPHDRLNSTVDDETQEIIQHRPVHLGIATDTESGLMVPVIRDAQKYGVLELARQIGIMAKAARERTVPRDLLTGSTFTVSNFGSYAGRFGTPIINYPEAGILAVGRAREGVVVRNGMIGVGKLLPLSLSADHRVVDGGTATLAVARIIELLQSPDQLMAPAR